MPLRTDDPFVRMCATIRELLGQVIRDEVTTRHRIGEVVLEIVRSPEAYGTHSVERAADELGISSDVLYRSAAVAETWSRKEIRELCARTNRRGEPLSWSHWIELSRVLCPDDRTRLIDLALARAWSVRELRRHIALAASEGAAHGRGSVRAALAEGVRTAKRAAADLAVFTSALEAQLEEGGADDTLVARALDACDELHERLVAARACLEEVSLASSRKLRVAPRSEPPALEDEAEQARAAARTRKR